MHVQAKQVEKEAGLSQEALENMGWPYEELQALEQLAKAEREMRNILRTHRLMSDDEDDPHKLRANIQQALQVHFQRLHFCFQVMHLHTYSHAKIRSIFCVYICTYTRTQTLARVMMRKHLEVAGNGTFMVLMRL
jgi:hypothetical protein